MMLQAPCLRNPYSFLPLRVPSIIPPIQEEPDLRPLPVHVPINPSPNSNQNQRNQIPSTTLISEQCGNGKDQPSLLVEGAKIQWEVVNGHSPIKGGPQQCWSPPMNLLEGGDIQAAPGPMQGFGVVGCPTQVQWAPPLWFPIPYWCLQHRGFMCHEGGEDPGLSPGAAGLCHRVRGPNRHSLWVSTRTSKVHGPPEDSQQWWHCWSLPSNTHGRWTWTPPTLEEEAALLGKETKPLLVPGSSPKPAKWSITLSASSPSPTPQSNCPPPWGKRSLRRELMLIWIIPVDGFAFTSRPVPEVPEWWREFQLLIPSPDESFGEVLVQRMACQQAMAFRLTATQLEWHGSWTTLPCLGSLEWRDFLPLKDFKGAQGYWVVQAEETVVLAKAL